MKTALKISIVLNLGLLGGLIFIWANQRGVGVMSALPVETKNKPPLPTIAVSAPPIVQQMEPVPFCWSQLQSSDYRMYVKNLRDIGCPEVTLRAIVTDDMNALYQKRSQALVQQLVDINNSSWSVQFKSLSLQQALRAELQKLPGEEVAKIADLLGLQSAPAREVAMNTGPSSQADTVPPTQVADRRNGSPNTRVMMPLVFQNVDPSVLKLDGQQLQAIKDLRQSFMNEIGALNQNRQNPTSINPDSQNPASINPDPQNSSVTPINQNLQNPTSKESWQTAQVNNDDLMRGYLGIMAWETYQVEAWNGP